MELLKYVQGLETSGKGRWLEGSDVLLCKSAPASRPASPQLTGVGRGQSDGEVYARRVGLPWPLTSGWVWVGVGRRHSR